MNEIRLKAYGFSMEAVGSKKSLSHRNERHSWILQKKRYQKQQ